MPRPNEVTPNGISVYAADPSGAANPVTISQFAQLLHNLSTQPDYNPNAPIELRITDGQSTHRFAAEIYHVQGFANGISIRASLPSTVKFRMVK